MQRIDWTHGALALEDQTLLSVAASILSSETSAVVDDSWGSSLRNTFSMGVGYGGIYYGWLDTIQVSAQAFFRCNVPCGAEKST